MGAWSSHARQSVSQTIPIVKPIIDERKAKMEEYGEEWTDKPVSCSKLKCLVYGWPWWLSLTFASELGGYVSVDLGGVYGKESP